jgi:hypothetical protein
MRRGRGDDPLPALVALLVVVAALDLRPTAAGVLLVALGAALVTARR